ncbi:hypothetical protein Tco_0864624 [Tanacetum coccineum]
MSAKDSIVVQTYELFEEEFNEFLALYSIPSSYHVILPKSYQTVLDAPPGYFGLYTHSFLLPILEMAVRNFVYVEDEKDLSFLPKKPSPAFDFFLLRKDDALFPNKTDEDEASSEYSDGRLPLDIEQHPMFQQMAFRNFVYAEDEKDLSFLPNEPSPAFGTGSPSVLVNIEPLMTDEEPVLQLAEATPDSRGSPKRELFVVHPGSVAARMKNRKCKTRGGSSRPLVMRKLAPGSLTACATRKKTSASKDDVYFLTISDEDEGLSDVPELKDVTACHLKFLAITPPSWKNLLDNYMDLELLDLHDRCYARQAFVDNAVNRRSSKLLGVIEKLKGECDVIKERERAREEESEGLRAKCEASMSDFEKNPTVVALREKISTLSSEVVSLVAEKPRLEVVKVSLRKEVDDVRRDRMEVVLKVVPYAAMELIHSDDLGSLVGKLVTSAIVYGRCKAFEQVAAMKEPFDLIKVKGYHPSDPVEVLLSKKPPSIQKPAPSKTQALVASYQKATSSSILASNTMSSPADTFVVKPSS